MKRSSLRAMHLSLLAAVMLAGAPVKGIGAARETPEWLNWELGVQAYTFRNFTFCQTLERCRELGVTVVEIYPGQRIGGGLPGATNHHMDAATRMRLLGKLAAARVRLGAYGVVNGKDPGDWRRIFEFARAMGISTVVSEPPPEQMDMIEALCREFGTNLAIHNHAKPSRYWGPEKVLEVCKGRDRRIGACADLGHWARSGLDPTACLRKLEGRVISLHLKDVNLAGTDGVCVPLGTGVGRLPRVFAELRRQRFHGLFSIEYESDPRDPLPAVRQCVEYFRRCQALSTIELLAGKALPPGMSWNVRDTWRRLDRSANAKWPEPEKIDLSAYVDTTDDGRGRIAASGEGFPNEHYPNAFDNKSSTKWCIKTPTIWIQYEYPGKERHRVTAYTITSANDSPDRDPCYWKLLGSNDGKTWTVVDSREKELFFMRFQKRLFKVKTPGAYHIYKLDVTRNHGNPTTSQLAEIELLEDKPGKGR